MLKHFQVINYLVSLFWWNIVFFYLFCFIIYFWFTSWINFISYFISNQPSSGFYITALFGAGFAGSILVFVAESINFLPYLSSNVLTKNKKPYPLTLFLCFGFVEYLIFIMSTQWLVSSWHYVEFQVLY